MMAIVPELHMQRLCRFISWAIVPVDTCFLMYTCVVDYNVKQRFVPEDCYTGSITKIRGVFFKQSYVFVEFVVSDTALCKA